MRPSPPSRPQPPFRPPGVSLLYAAVLILATYWFFDLGKSGHSVASLASMFTGGWALINVHRAITDQTRKKAHENKVKKHKSKAKEHGRGRWSEHEEIMGNENFAEDEGMLIGTAPDATGKQRDVRLVGRKNVGINGPAGAGKSTGFTFPAFASLISCPKRHENVVCFDPACEKLAIFWPWLWLHGYDIVLMSGFIDYTRRISKVKHLQDVGLDVFCSISLEMSAERISQELQSIAERVFPDPIQSKDPNHEFFVNMARKFLIYFAWRELGAGIKPTLPNIAAEFLKGPHYLADVFAKDEDNDCFSGLLAERAASYGGVMGAKDQVAGGYELAEQTLTHFAKQGGVLGAHASNSTFDLRRLKNPDEKIALFVVYPLEHLTSHAKQAALAMTHISDTLAACGPGGLCTIFIQETGAIPLGSLARNLNQYRKVGLRYVTDFQDIFGQTEYHYGKSLRQQLLSGLQIKLATSGIVEYESLKYFSSLCGTRGLDTSSLSDRASMGDAMPDLSPGMGHVSVPHCRPEEIRVMNPGNMLMISDSLQPAVLQNIPYWQRDEWKDYVAPNPWYLGD